MLGKIKSLQNEATKKFILENSELKTEISILAKDESNSEKVKELVNDYNARLKECGGQEGFGLSLNYYLNISQQEKASEELYRKMRDLQDKNN